MPSGAGLEVQMGVDGRQQGTVVQAQGQRGLSLRLWRQFYSGEEMTLGTQLRFVERLPLRLMRGWCVMHVARQHTTRGVIRRLVRRLPRI